MTPAALSVVVIGRNEAPGIARLFRSLEPLMREIPTETIYVDSASTDRSAMIAASCFDRTIVLHDDPQLCASAGRFVGAEAASGDWLLFLDGDMILDSAIVPDLLAHMELQSGEGAIGNYVYLYDDGSSRVLRPFVKASGHVEFFGGAVLLPAAALAEENWDPRLFAYEEIELYTRLRARGWHVRLIDKPFVHHHTERIPLVTMLISMYRRRNSVLGKKFLGVGQMLAARRASRSLGSLFRWFPEPLVMWIGVVAGLAFAAMDHWLLGAAAVAAAATFVSLRKSPRYVIVYLGFLPQAVHGIRAFARDWRPRIDRVETRGDTMARAADTTG